MKLFQAIFAASALGADVLVEDSATIAYPNAEATTSWTITAANNGYLSMQFNENETKLGFFVSRDIKYGNINRPLNSKRIIISVILKGFRPFLSFFGIFYGPK